MGIPVDELGLQEKDGFQNASKIAKVTKPTFILHAQFDEVIPLNQADILLKNSGARRKEMVVIPGAGHNDIIFAAAGPILKRSPDLPIV